MEDLEKQAEARDLKKQAEARQKRIEDATAAKAAEDAKVAEERSKMLQKKRTAKHRFHHSTRKVLGAEKKNKKASDRLELLTH